MRGCLTCRQRHVRCDKPGEGECQRCLRSGRECLPAPASRNSDIVSFRHGLNPSIRKNRHGSAKYGERDLSFSTDQIWVDVPERVVFKDETDRTAADYEVTSTWTTASVSKTETSSQILNDLGSPSRSGRDSLSGRQQDISPLDSHLLPPATLPIRGQKLLDLNEAHLLRHFQLVLGSWLDVCDPQRHFSVHVVQRAPTSPLLLYACLAIAARQLSLTSGSVLPETADDYHERCVAILLPMLENADFDHQIHILLSSTVILRLFEQISSNAPANDMQRHLLAGSVYVSSRVDCAVSGGLSQASFWTFVVQDIQFSLAYQIPLKLPFEPFNNQIDRAWRESHPAEDDEPWVQRAIWLLAKTINSCYGSASPRGSDPVTNARATLKGEIAAWERHLPEAFQPLFFAPADPTAGQPFPNVWYSQSWHAAAIQYICIAKALLLAQDLRELHVGFSASQDIRETKDHILEHLNILFGIALSTSADAPARIMACHTLCACGSFISDPLAQRFLLELLRTTEREDGWPWTYVMEKLMDEWGASVHIGKSKQQRCV